MSRKLQHCHQCGHEIYFNGICIDCRAENERTEILSWTQEKIDAEIHNICDEIKAKNDLEEKSHIFQKLVNYRDINTGKIAEIAFQYNVFYPYDIYKDAPDYIIKEMINLLMNDDTKPNIVGNLQLCLAIHGGDEVFNAFLELEKRPRKHRKKLNVNPSIYAAYGGWTFDEKGGRIETQFNKCYPMVKGSLVEKKISPVKIATKTKERCIRCDCEIVNILEIDGNDSRLNFLGIKGVIKVKCCPNCITFQDENFSRYTLQGESEIIYDTEGSVNEDYLKEKGINELTNNAYILGKEPVPLRYAADWMGGSSIGGFPFWIQDCEIKTCPDCGKPMKYLAQIQWDTVLDDMEGNAYIEICTHCNIVAILHQQT